MRSRKIRKEDHNIGTHKEKMQKRKAKRALRVVTVRKVKTGKYTPSIEDKKHNKG